MTRKVLFTLYLTIIKARTALLKMLNSIPLFRKFILLRFVKNQYKTFVGSNLNLQYPYTFNQKLQWLKVYGKKDPTFRRLADKLAVREYVESKIGREHLIPLVHVFTFPQDINWDALPENIILKLNHGSGWNVIIRDKQKANRLRSMENINRWYYSNYYDISKEWVYDGIKPAILCEKLLVDAIEPSREIHDYKVFVFNNRAYFIQVDVNRFSNHKRVFFDRQWIKQPFSTYFPLFEGDIPKPNILDELLISAEKLAPDHPFVRIDFYVIGDKYYFGEITFFHGGGHEPFSPVDWDLTLGTMITLPENMD